MRRSRVVAGVGVVVLGAGVVSAPAAEAGRPVFSVDCVASAASTTFTVSKVPGRTYTVHVYVNSGSAVADTMLTPTYWVGAVGRVDRWTMTKDVNYAGYYVRAVAFDNQISRLAMTTTEKTCTAAVS